MMSFKSNPEICEILKRHQNREKVSRSEVIRRSIRFFDEFRLTEEENELLEELASKLGLSRKEIVKAGLFALKNIVR